MRTKLQMLLTLATAVVATEAFANSWTNSGSGFWQVGANWDNGVPPDSLQAAIRITNTFSKTVTIDATTTTGANTNTMTIQKLRVFNAVSGVNTLALANAGTTVPLRVTDDLLIDGGGVLTVSNSAVRTEGALGGAFHVDNGTAILISGTISNTVDSFVGENIGSAGRMTIRGGSFVGPRLAVGQFEGSVGTLTVSGGILSLTQTNALIIGRDGTATPPAKGVVWLTGTGQILLNHAQSFARIGNTGDGQLIISNGSFQVTSLLVGNSGLNGASGTFTVAGGTSLVRSNFDIGDNPTATGAVWMTSGQLTATGDVIRIGNRGVGQLTLTNGTLLAGSISVGRQQGSRGTLTVSGGSLDCAGRLALGRFAGGTGTLWMVNGLLTVTNSALRVGDEGIGRATVSNGTLQVRDVLVATNTAARGTLSFAGGTLMASTSFLLGNFACDGLGVVTMDGGNVFVTNSLVTGVLEVRNRTFTYNAGTLRVDRIVVTNACGRFVRTGPAPVVGSPPLLGIGMDADGDGLPNEWESANGLDPLSPIGVNGAAGDLDNDGYSNLQEYAAGTAPNNAASFPLVSNVQIIGNNVLVQIGSVTGRNYQLQARDSLTTGVWVDLPGIVAGTGSTVTLTNLNGALQPVRLLRVKITLP